MRLSGADWHLLTRRHPAVLLLIVFALGAGMTWHYVNFFLPAVTGRQHVPFEAHQRPYVGIDLYPYWLGTRELFSSHQSPYCDDIARRTQTELYGRPIEAERPGEPKDQHRFSYPIFVVFLIAPVQHLPFTTVRIVAFFSWIALVVATFLMWIEALTPALSARWKIAGAILILTSYPALEAIFAEQISIIVAALLAGTIFCLRRGLLQLAGVMFALASVKPRNVLRLKK